MKNWSLIFIDDIDVIGTRENLKGFLFEISEFINIVCKTRRDLFLQFLHLLFYLLVLRKHMLICLTRNLWNPQYPDFQSKIECIVGWQARLGRVLGELTLAKCAQALIIRLDNSFSSSDQYFPWQNWYPSMNSSPNINGIISLWSFSRYSLPLSK